VERSPLVGSASTMPRRMGSPVSTAVVSIDPVRVRLGSCHVSASRSPTCMPAQGSPWKQLLVCTMKSAASLCSPSNANARPVHTLSPLVARGTPAASFRTPSKATPRPMQTILPPLAQATLRSRPVLVSSVHDTSPHPAALPDAAIQKKLDTDSIVRVGDRILRLSTRLGAGSFGAVWAAVDQDGREVALKEVLCRSGKALAEAEFECDLLERLSMTKSHNEERGTPLFVATEKVSLGPDSNQVLLAMTRVPGEDLSDFIEKRKHTFAFPEACRFVRQLLVQLVPIFESLSTHAIHRDVTPRNILVENGDVGIPQFGLIDFGLAVDASEWQSGGKRSWYDQNVSGDARCWPVSTWTMFAKGPDALGANPVLCLEYMMFLDFHSLGITALQVLAELSRSFGQSDTVLKTNFVLCEKLQILQVAWETYWEHAVRFWRGNFDTIQKGGDVNALRQAYIDEGFLDIISNDLRVLRASLHETQHVCQNAPSGADLADVAALMSALQSLICSGEKFGGVPSWRYVRTLLCSTEDSGNVGGLRLGCKVGQLGQQCSSTSCSTPTTAAPSPRSESLASLSSSSRRTSWASNPMVSAPDNLDVLEVSFGDLMEYAISH